MEDGNGSFKCGLGVIKAVNTGYIVHEQVVIEVLKQEQNPCSPHTQFFELNLVLIWAKLSI